MNFTGTPNPIQASYAICFIAFHKIERVMSERTCQVRATVQYQGPKIYSLGHPVVGWHEIVRLARSLAVELVDLLSRCIQIEFIHGLDLMNMICLGSWFRNGTIPSKWRLL